MIFKVRGRLFPKVQMSSWRPPMELPDVLEREWLLNLSTSDEIEPGLELGSTEDVIRAVADKFAAMPDGVGDRRRALVE